MTKMIYRPRGLAGEYATYAVNFYLGCSNGCRYCFLKKGVTAEVFGGDKPVLRKGYASVNDELKDFEKEVRMNIEKLRRGGIFMSFTTDPMLKETGYATLKAAMVCVAYGIPVTILTKCTSEYGRFADGLREYANIVTIGTTLTGHDELEPNAATNGERIDMLRKAKEDGFSTFVSLEPVIDFKSSIQMVCEAVEYTDEFRIGLKTPVKKSNYPKKETDNFVRTAKTVCDRHGVRVVWKETMRKLAEFYGLKI